MSTEEIGNTLLDRAIKSAAAIWLADREDQVTRTYHFLVSVTEKELVLYDKYLAKQIETLEASESPMPTAISILKVKREFTRILMYCRAEVASRCPLPADQEAAEKSLNDEELAWVTRRQPEQ